MGINILGRRNMQGGGRFFGGFTDAMRALTALDQSIQEYDYLDPNDQTACVSSVSSNDINIHSTNVNSLPREMLPKKWPTLPGVSVHWAVFETTILPQDELQWLTAADVVFVPSHWGKQVLIDNGLKAEDIEVVPEGIDPDLFHPFLRGCYPRDDVFRVLVVGKFEIRKGFPEFRHGFAKAFGGDEKARLLLKSDSPWMKTVKSEEAYEDNLDQLRHPIRDSGAENIRLLIGDYSDADLFHFYNACDLLLFPSRAEGWGLPLLEAVSCGLPVAATYYSGHTDFLRPIKDKCQLIDFSLVPIGDGRLGQSAYASADAIAESLIHARDNIDSFRPKALEAASVVRTQFSWQKAAEACVVKLAQRFPEALKAMSAPFLIDQFTEQ